MKTRLLIVDSSDFRRFPLGGINIFIRNILRHLPRQFGVALGGITTEENCAVGEWTKVDLGFGIFDFFPFARFIRSGMGRRPFVPNRIVAMVGLLRRINPLLSPGFQVVYCPYPELVLPFVYPRVRLPAVFHLHGLINTTVRYSRYPFLRTSCVAYGFRAMTKTVLQKSYQVLTVSQEGVEACLELAPRMRSPPRVIPPVVDPHLFTKRTSRIRSDLGIVEDAQVVAYAGRLERPKGVEILIRAVTQLRRSGRDAHLLVLGEGSDQTRLKEVARSMRVNSYVRFVGEVDHDTELPTWLSAADVFAIASSSEGLTTSVLEALACGLPIVCSAVGGLPDLVVDGVTGFLVRSWEVSDFAAALASALDNRTRLGQSCPLTVATFSAERVAEQMAQLFEEAATATKRLI